MEIPVERGRSFVIDANHWSRELKCNVCLDYFTDPHTLNCGHSFCVCCLKRLAQAARDQHYTTAFSKVKFLCPTCRFGTLAKPFLRESIMISYVIRDVAEGWKKEKQRFCSENGSISLRSVGSQTPLIFNNRPEIKGKPISKPDTCERVFPDDKYVTKVMIVTESEESGPDNTGHVSSTSSSSSAHSTSDTASEWENFDRVGQPDETRQEDDDVDSLPVDIRVLWSPGRVIMTFFWFVYTALVSVIAHGFLPYMILYTLMFLLILYTENMQRRN